MKRFSIAIITSGFCAFHLQDASAFSASFSNRYVIESIPFSSSSLFASENDSSVESLREEIESMKREALEKLNALDDKVSSLPRESPVSTVAKDLKETENKYDTSKLEPIEVNNETETEYMNRRLKERMAVSNDPEFSPMKIMMNTRDEALLDGSKWKLSLDIGREPGTWMPSDWGISGERLKLDFECEFTGNQLYEREDFLGSMGDAKELQVMGSKLVLSPSITEGSREIQVKNGGWRVAKGRGPNGSDILRFYIEIDEEIKRKSDSSDVYCPAGRIYLSCGFFNMKRPANGEKSRYKKRLDDLITRAEELDEEIANAGFFEKFGKNAEMIRLKVEMQDTADRFRGASILEPDSSILKFTPTGEAAITKEGGVCCKVVKGVGVEYHILGRFYCQASRNQ